MFEICKLSGYMWLVTDNYKHKIFDKLSTGYINFNRLVDTSSWSEFFVFQLFYDR